VSVVVLEVPGDGVRAIVQTRGGQLLAESEDELDDGGVEGAW
jgi:hypothetical protein